MDVLADWLDSFCGAFLYLLCSWRMEKKDSSLKIKGGIEMKHKIAICLNRQYGSGGHELGERLAQKLGVTFYDKNILKYEAHYSGIAEEFLSQTDEQPTDDLLYHLSVGERQELLNLIGENDYLTNDRLFMIQQKIIRNLADQGSCVIIGRCASTILHGCKNCIRVFVQADWEARVKRICQVKRIDKDMAQYLIKRVDRKRAAYHNFYSDHPWGLAESYDISINTTVFGMDSALELLVKMTELADAKE